MTPDASDVSSLEDLSEKQRKTIRLIRDHPEETKTELARWPNVSAPTISNHVNSNEGFE